MATEDRMDVGFTVEIATKHIAVAAQIPGFVSARVMSTNRERAHVEVRLSVTNITDALIRLGDLAAHLGSCDPERGTIITGASWLPFHPETLL